MKRQVLGRQCRGPVFLIGGVVSRTAFAHEAPLSRSYADGTALFYSRKARSFDGRCSSETSDPQRRKNLSKCLPSGANSCKKTQRLLRKIAGKITRCNERQQNGTFHPSSFTRSERLLFVCGIILISFPVRLRRQKYLPHISPKHVCSWPVFISPQREIPLASSPSRSPKKRLPARVSWPVRRILGSFPASGLCGDLPSAKSAGKFLKINPKFGKPAADLRPWAWRSVRSVVMSLPG